MNVAAVLWGSLPIKEYLEGIIEEREEAGNPLSTECCDALFRFVNTSDNTRTSILASFNAPWASGPTRSWMQRRARTTSTYGMSDAGGCPVYIGITPDYLPVAGRLVNLFFSQLINLNTKVDDRRSPLVERQEAKQLTEELTQNWVSHGCCI